LPSRDSRNRQQISAVRAGLPLPNCHESSGNYVPLRIMTDRQITEVSNKPAIQLMSVDLKRRCLRFQVELLVPKRDKPIPVIERFMGPPSNIFLSTVFFCEENAAPKHLNSIPILELLPKKGFGRQINRQKNHCLLGDRPFWQNEEAIQPIRGEEMTRLMKKCCYCV